MIETCRLRTSAAADARLGPWRRTMTPVSATDAGIRPSRQPSDRLSGPGKYGALWAQDHGHDPHRPSPNTHDSACLPAGRAHRGSPARTSMALGRGEGRERPPGLAFSTPMTVY